MKKKTTINQLDVWKRVRKLWIRNPKTQIVPNKKKKSRQKVKQDLKKQIKEI